jgi:predicted secreted protein
MASVSIAGVGTLFQRWDGATWVSIAEINAIIGPSAKRDNIDVTSFDTEAGYREFAAGFKDGDTVSLSMNFTRDSFELMVNDFLDDDPQYYQILFLDEDATVIAFEGLVNKLPLELESGDKIKANVSIKVTGQLEESANPIEESSIDISSEDIPEVSSEDTSEGSYESELVTYVAGLTTPLSDEQMEDLNDFIIAAKAAMNVTNLSDKADLLYILSGETEESSLRNLAQDAYHCTKEGVVTFEAFAGFTGGTVAKYLKTGYQAATHGSKFTQNDAGDMVYIHGPVFNTGALTSQLPTGVKDVINSRYDYITPKVSIRYNMHINQASEIDGSRNYSYDGGMYASFRDDSDSIRGYINTIELTNKSSINSTALSNLEDFILCGNVDGTPTYPVPYAISFKYKGATLTKTEYTNLLKAFETYMIAKGTGILPYVETQADFTNVAASKVSVFAKGVNYTDHECEFRVPVITITANGVILMFGNTGYYGNTDYNMSDCGCRRSLDGGVTWGPDLIAIHNNGVYTSNVYHGSRIVNFAVLTTPTRVYLFACKIDDETYIIYYGYESDPLIMQTYFGYVYSDDDGATWSAWQDLSTLKTAETNLLAPSPTQGIILTNGTWVIPCLDHRYSANTDDEDSSAADWGIRSCLVYSTDNGANWQISSEIEQFTDESSIVEYEPNKILMISRPFSSNQFLMYTTDDLGATWAVSSQNKLVEGKPHSVGFHKYTYNGVTKFLMSKSFGDGRYDCRMRVSDDLITWGNVYQYAPELTAGYSCMASNAAGDLVLAAEATEDLNFWNLTSIKNDLIQ